jgi:hypothetical protein
MYFINRWNNILPDDATSGVSSVHEVNIYDLDAHTPAKKCRWIFHAPPGKRRTQSWFRPFWHKYDVSVIRLGLRNSRPDTCCLGWIPLHPITYCHVHFGLPLHHFSRSWSQQSILHRRVLLGLLLHCSRAMAYRMRVGRVLDLLWLCSFTSATSKVWFLVDLAISPWSP